jgi:hypothetical protein
MLSGKVPSGQDDATQGMAAYFREQKGGPWSRRSDPIVMRFEFRTDDRPSQLSFAGENFSSFDFESLDWSIQEGASCHWTDTPPPDLR